MTNALEIELSKCKEKEPFVKNLVKELMRWDEVFRRKLVNWKPT